MSKTRSPTTDNRPKPNANALRKHSLPAQFGSMTDSFQVGDPGGATKTADKGDDKRLGKSLNGLDESKLASTVRPSPAQARTVPITDACQPRGRPPSSATLPALIDTRSYRAAVKCTPPSSPVAPPSLLLPPITNTSKPIMSAWSPATPQRPKLDTDTSSFPPLSPVPSSSKPSTSTGTKSYAKCFEPASTTTPVLERQVQNQEMPSSPPPSSSSPSTAKVITLNITPPRDAVSPAPRRTPPSPTTPSKAPRKKSSAPAPAQALRLPERARSASVSSISSTPSYASTAPTSVARPYWESEEWYVELVAYARGMSKKNRRAWEKILRSDPKDTSKMKWAEFDSALKALGFESKTRGGSDLEYTPSRFGENAQPISYHRPHPGQEFSLGDLKAKAYSFRLRYPGAVAALHEAWELVDTRC